MRTLLVPCLLLVPLALATHTPTPQCEPSGDPSLGILQVGQGDRAWYVEDRGDEIHVYEETNGIWSPDDPAHSLQRGGSNPYVPDDPDLCVDDPLVIPDTKWL